MDSTNSHTIILPTLVNRHIIVPYRICILWVLYFATNILAAVLISICLGCIIMRFILGLLFFVINIVAAVLCGIIYWGCCIMCDMSCDCSIMAVLWLLYYVVYLVAAVLKR